MRFHKYNFNAYVYDSPSKMTVYSYVEMDGSIDITMAHVENVHLSTSGNTANDDELQKRISPKLELLRC